MKKMLLSFAAICAAFSMNAQVDTLTSFFSGTPTMYTVGAAQGGGYVAGTNGYGDLSKFQRFDAQTGIIATGNITGCLLWVGAKNDNGGSFDVVVRDFSGAAMGADIESVNVTLASADTSLAGLNIANGTVGYNVAVTFANPIPFTSASDLVVGIVLPTTAGDTVGLVNNTDGDFPLGASHSIEEWSDNSVQYFGDANNWDLTIAMAIFPIVEFAVGLNENAIEASVYPNPANNVLNVKTSKEAATVSIIGMDGKVVSTQTVNGTTASVNVADLNAGVYFYEVVAADGTIARNTFVKN